MLFYYEPWVSERNTCNTQSYSRGMNFGMDVIIHMKHQKRKQIPKFRRELIKLFARIPLEKCKVLSTDIYALPLWTGKKNERNREREKLNSETKRVIAWYVYRVCINVDESRQFTWTQTAYIDWNLSTSTEKKECDSQWFHVMCLHDDWNTSFTHFFVSVARSSIMKHIFHF